MGGRLRPVGERQWRERNPWLLLEDGFRFIRGFVQRVEASRYGQFKARFGPDLMALRDAASNVVVRQGATLPPEDRTAPMGGTGARIRLVLTQPPVHWSPENLAFGYLATSLALGLDAALTLPLDAVFDPGTRHEGRSEWARDASELHRSLAAVRPQMGPDGTGVLLLDRQPSGAMVASVVGAVAAGFRLRDVTFRESGQDITGAIELMLPGGTPPLERDLPGPSFPTRPLVRPVDPSEPIPDEELCRAIAALAVSVLQARGEPARYERLLGEVLLGLDRTGHLRRVTVDWAAEERRAVGLPPEPLEAPDLPAAYDTGPIRVTADVEATDGTGLVRGDGDPRSVRDPGRPIRGRIDPAAPVPPPAEAPAAPAMSATLDPTPGPAGLRSAPDHASGPVSRAVTGTAAEPADAAHPAGVVDPVRAVLDAVTAELHRSDHPRLVEFEPGRWWLRDPRDIADARQPLSDRVEWAVYSLLSTSGGIAADAFTDRITSMFRGHDTPDEELIAACVESYRVTDPDSDGLLQAQGSLPDHYREHGELVAGLAELGHRLGLRAWICAARAAAHVPGPAHRRAPDRRRAARVPAAHHARPGRGARAGRLHLVPARQGHVPVRGRVDGDDGRAGAQARRGHPVG